MYAIEFRTKIKNGTIEIPREYQDRLRKQAGEDVRVIVLTGEYSRSAAEEGSDLIAELLTAPLRIPDFTPLNREEAHDRS
jgi:hypothetical protein